MDDTETLLSRIKAQNVLEYYSGNSLSSVYLDSAGAPIPSQLMLKNVFDCMVRHPLGNPHSSGTTSDNIGEFSSRSSHIINDTRDTILKYFGATAEQYDVVFTAGSTDAIKLVGETFPFGDSGMYMYPSNAHTSLLGVRCYSNNVKCITVDSLQHVCDKQSTRNIKSIDGSDNTAYNLLSVSGECNFSGAKLNLQNLSNIMKYTDSITELVENAITVKEKPRSTDLNGKWLWLLDASKLAQSSVVDISTMEYESRPNFVIISFYKMFGYPSGLGALLIRRDSATILKKHYYGGGTIAAASAIANYAIHRSRHPHEYLEDGTSNFYGISAIPHGFAMYERYGGMAQISRYLMHLTKFVVTKLLALTHDETGYKFCTIYGNHDAVKQTNIDRYNKIQGPVVAFNAYWKDGEEIGFAEFGAVAKASNIHVRTGCFCNVGACADSLNLTLDEIKYNYSQGRVCDDDTVDVVDGKNTGAIRVSFGLYNDTNDCEKFIEFIKSHFINRKKAVQGTKNLAKVTQSAFLLKHMFVYPIKSCAGISVQHWPLCSEGLKYDREFAILDAFSGTILTQKVAPKLALIQPSIDHSRGILTLAVRESMDPPMGQAIDVSLSPSVWCCDNNVAARICGRKVCYNTINEQANAWLSKYMEKSVRLIRFSSAGMGINPAKTGEERACSTVKVNSFSNDSPFLLLSEESVLDLLAVTKNDEEPIQFMQRLRPNFVISGACDPYYEDQMERMVVAGSDDTPVIFTSNGPCQRCTAVDVNSQNGEKDGNLFATMSAYRKQGGKVTFGHLLQLDSTALDTIREKEIRIASGISIDIKFV